MKSSIITIGDEILIGQIVDTNSAWLGQELTGLGIEVDTIYSIADTEKAIVDTLDLAIEGSDLILITGGLGPTKDDVTKHSLNKYFNSDTYFDESLYNKIAAYFNMRGLPITDYLKEQCKMPEKAEILTNNVGTAPGMLFKHKGKIIVSMPGVPHEMKWIFEKSLKPNLDKYLKLEYIICQQTIKTVGIGETLIATMIEDVLHEMPDNTRHRMRSTVVVIPTFIHRFFSMPKLPIGSIPPCIEGTIDSQSGTVIISRFDRNDSFLAKVEVIPVIFP